VIARGDIDGALAASNMELMAQAHGLGVLYSGFFTMAARLSRGLRRELGLGRKQKVVPALVLGDPAVRYRRTAPKEAAAISWKGGCSDDAAARRKWPKYDRSVKCYQQSII